MDTQPMMDDPATALRFCQRCRAPFTPYRPFGVGAYEQAVCGCCVDELVDRYQAAEAGLS